MKNIPLGEIMTSPVVTLKLEEPFSHVEEKLRIKGIRHLPVVDQANKVIGLITQRDLYRTLSPRKNLEGETFYDPASLDNFLIKYAMTPNPATLHPEDSVSKAVSLMAVSRYGCIPIVDEEKRILGIVTEIDILKLLDRELSREKAA